MTSTSAQDPDPSDPYFIPNVPMYVEHLGQDNDDTLGDEFFNILALENAKENAASPKVEPPPTSQQSRPQRPQRRSVLLPNQNAPKLQVVPSQRRSLMNPSQKTLPPLPKVTGGSTFRRSVYGQTQPAEGGPVTRSQSAIQRAQEANANNDHMAVFANVDPFPDDVPRVKAQPRPLRRSMMFAADGDGGQLKPKQLEEDDVPRVKAQPRPLRRSMMLAAAQAAVADGGGGQLKAKQLVEQHAFKENSAALNLLVVPKPFNVASIPASRPAVAAAAAVPITPKKEAHYKPTLIQPPMRFGTASAQRRSVINQNRPSTSASQQPIIKKPFIQPPMRFGNAPSAPGSTSRPARPNTGVNSIYRSTRRAENR